VKLSAAVKPKLRSEKVKAMFSRTSAADFDPSDFSRRHIGPSPGDVSEMLSTV